MEEFNLHKPGTFCWVELATTNTEEAKKFYTDIFGLEALDTPAGEGMIYTMLLLQGKPIGALYEMSEQQRSQMPPYWMPYVSVENAADTLNKVKDLSGAVIMEAFDVMDAGRMGLFQDPEGAFLCVWEPKKHIGSSYKNVPGSLCWVEHASREPEKAIPFLEKLFGWSSKTEKMGEMVYTTFFIREEPVAGLYIMPPDMKDIPSHWLPYFMSDNIDMVIEKSTGYGGQILMPKTFIEGVGNFCVIRDPQGAVFGVVQ